MTKKSFCITSTFLLFFGVSNSQELIDLSKWRTDSMGCMGYRLSVRVKAAIMLDFILKLQGSDYLLQNLGEANITRKLGKKNILYYYSDCNIVFPHIMNLRAEKDQPLEIDAVAIVINKKRKVVKITRL